ncbi:hypothetical protein LOAG_08176 [Loa loa]|uniref:RAP domain-containing protein n=1 Tax=Loa loa TaxID=7209 RepID=A0A1I7W0L2_LOALO|nr:hypothetical protein LOAG_08176 [Loa loa]EFO20313.1 hypothetical protein LOAG_08176 [Loa loa]
MTLTKAQIFGSLLSKSRALMQYCRYKSCYTINDRLQFENDEENEEEKEVRSKYVFRSRLPVLIDNDYFDATFQYEYDRICRECFAWDSEMNTVKTVWDRLKPPPQEKVEDYVLMIGNSRSLPWAPNEWCIERAFDCYRNRRDVTRIHLTIKYLEMLKRLPNLRVGVMLDMAHHIQQKILIERTRKLFEMVCQTYYTGDLTKLIESDENAKPIVEYMYQVEQLEAEKREVLNITEHDIVTVAPGLYGAIQDFFRVYFASTYSLSITCCALHQKSILYRVADQKYKLMKNQIAMPYEYSYNVPHLVFGNFGYWYSRRRRQFELHDLHILAFPVLPWYKDLPGTYGKFFSPKYERIPLSTSIFI